MDGPFLKQGIVIFFKNSKILCTFTYIACNGCIPAFGDSCEPDPDEFRSESNPGVMLKGI